jgi:hypothetical protein
MINNFILIYFGESWSEKDMKNDCHVCTTKKAYNKVTFYIKITCDVLADKGSVVIVTVIIVEATWCISYTGGRCQFGTISAPVVGVRPGDGATCRPAVDTQCVQVAQPHPWPVTQTAHQYLHFIIP